MEFKDRFKLLRYETELSQTELAKELNVSKATIGMWEIGSRMPGREKLSEIADFFNVDINYLYGKQVTKRRPSINIDDSYYQDSSTAELANFLKDNPEYQVLFDASSKVKPEDIEKVAQMIKIFNGEG